MAFKCKEAERNYKNNWSKAWRLKNPVKHAEHMRKARTKLYQSQRYKDYLQLGHWKYRGIKNQDGSQFGWSDYNRLFAQQDGRCALCNKHQSECKKALCADHNHTTHYVRGLLCNNCNCRLSMFENKDFRKKCELYLSLRPGVTE